MIEQRITISVILTSMNHGSPNQILNVFSVPVLSLAHRRIHESLRTEVPQSRPHSEQNYRLGCRGRMTDRNLHDVKR